MMKRLTKYLILITILFFYILQISCAPPRGFVVTNENDTLKGGLYVPEMNNVKKISIDPHYRMHPFKYNKIKFSDVKSVNFFTKKNGLMVFEPIDSINLWWVVGREKNVGIYYTSWDETNIGTAYTAASDDSYHEIILLSLNQKIDFSQVSIVAHVQNLLLPKVKTYGLLTRKDLPLILNFIDYRYKQNLSYTNFMNDRKEVVEQKMISYILDKENERENE